MFGMLALILHSQREKVSNMTGTQSRLSLETMFSTRVLWKVSGLSMTEIMRVTP